MGSALLNPATTDSTRGEAPESAEALRLEVAERLAAHRLRRGQAKAQHAPSGLPRESSKGATTRAARIAAAVAERYANSQSYRAFLAAEAERAIQQARAAAEVAAFNAQAVAAAQQRLLEAFDEAAHANAADINNTEADANADGIPHLAAEVGTRNAQGDESHFEARLSSAHERMLWAELDAGDAELPSAQSSKPNSSGPARDHAGRGTRLSHRSHPHAAEPALAQPKSGLAQPSAGFTVRLYEDASSAAHVNLAAPRPTALPGHESRRDAGSREAGGDARVLAAEALALDEEIAFRQSPVFEEPAGPPMPLPANLIEFPRQLVAPRKARPRLAEGPLREDSASAPAGQLRIFEVDPTQISTQPEPAVETEQMPQWTSIWLDTPGSATPAGQAHAQAATSAEADNAADPRPRTYSYPQAASIGRRVTASAINAAILLGGMLAFAAVSLPAAGLAVRGQSVRGIAGEIAAGLASRAGVPHGILLPACAVAGGFLYLLFQALFFTFSEATPGMRCARIALCTFDDENPTRAAIRRRALAVLLSACPLGVGFLWAALDEDRLTWHDRVSHMYQRKY